LLHEAIGSVAAQDLGDDLEVIVVNDAGPSVASVVREWDGVLAIRLLEPSRRSGPASTRNLGIEHARGQYLSFLDDDDLFVAGHLAAILPPLERGDADFVYAGAAVYNRRFLLVANYVHTASAMMRNFRDSPIRFDEELDVCEDWDMWLALAVGLDFQVQFVDEITSIYHQVPGVVGLVAQAQSVSPSRFSVARDTIHAKWPSDDSIVVGYRAWLTELEGVRSGLIAQGRSMPNLLFDDILSYLHPRVSAGRPPDVQDMVKFFLD
jgi:glycosyltransferase involved in cell wall biosynthesis